MTRHHIRTIDQLGRTLHRAEAFLLSQALRNGNYVRMCTCGTPIIGADEIALLNAIAEHLGLERVR